MIKKCNNFIQDIVKKLCHTEMSGTCGYVVICKLQLVKRKHPQCQFHNREVRFRKMQYATRSPMHASQVIVVPRCRLILIVCALL